MPLVIDDTSSILVYEGTTARVTGKLIDYAGNAIASSSIVAMTFTLFEEKSKKIINSRNAVNILNTNGGSVDSSGNFALILTPADNTFITTRSNEIHVVKVTFTFDTDKVGIALIRVALVNVDYTP